MTAITKCGHCGGTFWEIKTIEPRGGNYKQNIMQCVACGVPVGVMDYYNLGKLMKDNESAISQLKSQLNSVQQHLAQIEHVLRHK